MTTTMWIKTIFFSITITAGLWLAGCAAQPPLPASALVVSVAGPLGRVLKRHDAYIQADAGMADIEKVIALRETRRIREMMSAALENQP